VEPVRKQGNLLVLNNFVLS